MADSLHQLSTSKRAGIQSLITHQYNTGVPLSPCKSFLAHPCSACCDRMPYLEVNWLQMTRGLQAGTLHASCKAGNCNQNFGATAVSFMKDPTKVAHLKGLRAERLPSLKHSLSRRITAEPLSRQRAACGLPAYTSKAFHQPSLHKLL